MAEQLNIALAGNPNCGKTTLFNELTGSNGYVGNWPGVTVEKKEAVWRADKSVNFVDLPGIYSLSPYTPEEVVSRDYLVNDRPDAVIDLIDVTNLERNLYLATQILETGLPVVIGLNMCDLLKERGDVIDVDGLSERLGAPVIEVSALRNTNLDTLVNTAVESARTHRVAEGLRCFEDNVETALATIAGVVSKSCDSQLVRWFSIKTFERDVEAISSITMSKEDANACEAAIAAVEEERDDDSESIITTDRYEWIGDTMDECVQRAPKKLTRSEKIDRVVTNRWLGLPIFLAVMFLVYFLAVSTVGDWGTSWVNDNLFSDGFFIGGGQASYDEAVEEWSENHYNDIVSGYVEQAEEAGISGADEVTAALEEEEEAPVSAFESAAKTADFTATNIYVTDEDGNFVNTEGEAITQLDSDGKPATGTDPETIATVTEADFEKAVAGLGEEPDPANYGIYVNSIPTTAQTLLENAGASDVVTSLVVDGVIGGVGAVLGFIPQMVVLFILLCFLEDCGYMARVAFVMDRAFRKFGLSGKSFIPMIISTGCGVPGVMATKTIENEKDRRMTAMLTTMMPCGAKIPITALVMGALISNGSAWWITYMFWLMGIACIIVSALMLKKTKWFAGDPTPFIMELPDYHFPSIKSWFLHVWERIWAYIVKAFTIIFGATILVWFLSNFGTAGWDGGNGAFGFLSTMPNAPENYMDYSLLAGIGGALGFIFAPLGCDHWQATASSISALIAKENLVSTFGTFYGLGSDVTENSVNMWSGFANMFTQNGVLHAGAMCAFVAFNMLDAPCFAAIGTIRKQMNSPKWFWFAIGYQCGFAWVVGLIINQLWELFVLHNFGFWTIVAIAFLAGIIFMVVRPMPKYESEEKVYQSLEEKVQQG